MADQPRGTSATCATRTATATATRRQPTAVQPGVSPADLAACPDEASDREARARPERSARSPPHRRSAALLGAPPPPDQQQGKAGADQQAGSAGVGAVVGPPRVVRVVPPGQQHRRQAGSGGAQEDRAPHCGAACRHRPAPGQQTRQEQRPRQVELFLDAERPRVLQRRGCGGLREVVAPSQDHPPVRDVEQRRQPVTAKRPQLLGGQQRAGPECNDREHEQEGRQQPSGAATPERHQRDAPALLPLGEQEARDQVAGQHEEGVDAQEPTAGPGHPSVERQHGQDGQPAQPVEGGHVGGPVSRGPPPTSGPPLRRPPRERGSPGHVTPRRPRLRASTSVPPARRTTARPRSRGPPDRPRLALDPTKAALVRAPRAMARSGGRVL